MLKDNRDNRVLSAIQKIPEGYSEGIYEGHKYSIIKTTFNDGKSFKVYAKQLKGKNFISLNYYIISKQNLLKPCEMTNQKVVHFLENVGVVPMKICSVKSIGKEKVMNILKQKLS